MRKDERLIGAAEERRAILRKVRRSINKKAVEQEDLRMNWVLECLADWIMLRDKRYNARSGGLGRKN